MNISPYLIINGKSSREINGLLIQSLAPISKAPVKTKVETIDGRDGDIVTPLGFNAYDKTVSIGLTYNYDIDEVIEFFNSEGVVIFSNEPDKVYHFAIYNQIDFERLIRFKTAEVVFHVQPYKYSNNENPLSFAITSGVPVSVTNSGNTISKPDLMITGEGVVDLDINGEEILNIDFGESEQTYIIDSDSMNAYATENAIKDVKADFSASQASGTPTPDAPIPIVGVDKVNVVCTGKNLANIFVDGKVPSTTTGALVNAGGARTNFIKCLSREQYNLSCSNSQPLYVFFYDENKGFLNYISLTGTTLTVTTPLNAKYMMLRFGSNTVNNGMLEKGATASTFEPFGTTALINLGGTYYGGSVDCVTGKITLTHQAYTFDGSETWSQYSGGGVGVYFTIALSAAKYANEQIVICDHYQGQLSGAGNANYPDLSTWLTNTENYKRLYVKNSNFESTSDAQSGMNGVTVVYPLATPIELQASNTAEILAILGVNNVYSDAGDVEVTYKAGGVIHTETGEIVIFTLTPEDYERGSFVNRQIVGNYDNIKLKSGANTISLTGNATSLTVDKYSRWI